MAQNLGEIISIPEEKINEFALSILIPLWMLEPIATSSPHTVEELSKIFNVTQKAMYLQLQKLL